MTKKEIDPMPEFYDRYIDQVKEDDLLDALIQSQKALENIDVELLKNIGDNIYAPGKWTIKDIFQHIIDSERVFAYRALRFARADKTELSGYDEELYGRTSLANNRNLDDIIHELKIVRTSTILLFKSFDPSVIKNTGTCFNKKIPVLALGFVMAGHQNHHLNVIKTKYEPLVKNK